MARENRKFKAKIMRCSPAKTINFDSDSLPVIQVRREGVHLVFIRPCPFCGRRHYHGARGGPGRRASHCPDPAPGMAPPGREYVLKIIG